jgi:hypothetical protein
MTNPIQAMFEAGVVERTDFPPESRYHGVPTRTIEATDGSLIVYIARRFAPAPENFATLRERLVRQGERLDRLAAAEIGDPKAFWMLCDANGAVFAEELEQPGRPVRVTLPAGVASPDDEG